MSDYIVKPAEFSWPLNSSVPVLFIWLSSSSNMKPSRYKIVNNLAKPLMTQYC